jgi:hypothetical protein
MTISMEENGQISYRLRLSIDVQHAFAELHHRKGWLPTSSVCHLEEHV